MSPKIGPTDRTKLPRPFGNTNDTNERETRETGTGDGDCFQPTVSYRELSHCKCTCLDLLLNRALKRVTVRRDFLQRIRER